MNKEVVEEYFHRVALPRIAEELIDLALNDFENTTDWDIFDECFDWFEDTSTEVFSFKWCMAQIQKNPNILRREILEIAERSIPLMKFEIRNHSPERELHIKRIDFIERKLFRIYKDYD